MAHRLDGENTSWRKRLISCGLLPSVIEDTKSTNRRNLSLNKFPNRIEEVNAEQGGGHSIFVVAGSLRKLEPDAFLPQLVSIGPYHRNKDHLNEMKKHKRLLLENVLKRSNKPLDELQIAMSGLERDTRKCYDKDFSDISTEDFVDMMVLDACFILELFCGLDENPLSWYILRFMPFIQRDLLMLENQIPLFVLHKMFTLAWKDNNSPESIADLALKFFKPIIPGISGNLPVHATNEPPPWLHLLDIVHQSLIPWQLDSETGHLTCSHGRCLIPCPTVPLPHFCTSFCAARTGARDTESASAPPKTYDPPEIVMHSVTSLRGTGIKFIPNKSSTIFTDIMFEDGKLSIPRLLIHGSTKSTFLNLMAFEQCYPYLRRYITSYISFMDGLVDSSKDAEYLIEKKIITHELGSAEDVATLINNLRREMVFDTSDYYLSDESQNLDKHYQQKWQTWKATLKHRYLKDPWKVISLGAAISLIILTVQQTAFAIASYYQRKP